MVNYWFYKVEKNSFAQRRGAQKSVICLQNVHIFFTEKNPTGTIQSTEPTSLHCMVCGNFEFSKIPKEGAGRTHRSMGSPQIKRGKKR